ncbi:hypothetical protein GCM10020295_53230 [Streptomyces cinereospinus]
MAASAGRKRAVVAPSRQWTSASVTARALRAAVDLPGAGGAADPVAEPGEAFGEALGVVRPERPEQGGDPVGRRREEEGAGGEGLGTGDVDYGHALMIGPRPGGVPVRPRDGPPKFAGP